MRILSNIIKNGLALADHRHDLCINRNLSFRDRFDILFKIRPSSVSEQGYTIVYG